MRGKTFREIPAGDLFKIENTKSFNKDALSCGCECDYVTRTVSGRGVIAKTGLIADIKPNEARTFSLELLTCTIFFRNRPWYAGQFVKVLVPLDPRISDNWLYFETLLQKIRPVLASVLVRDVDDTFRKTLLKIPVDESGEIDFDYINSYISNIVNARKDAAKKYIKSIKSNDDNQIFGTELKHKTFKIEELFYKAKATKKKKIDKHKDVSPIKTKEFSLPLVNAKVDNNGIMYYGRPSDFTSVSLSLDIIQNGAIATGKVFAQPQPTGVLWDAYLIKIRNEDVQINENHLLYLSTILEKRIRETFDRDTKATWDRVKSLEISLPVDEASQEPDWDYMDGFIAGKKNGILSKIAI